MHQATPVTESLQAATYDYNVRIGELPFLSRHPSGRSPRRATSPSCTA